MTPLDQILTQMNRKGVSQRKLSDMLQVKDAYISALLREPFNPTLKTLDRIAKALNFTIKVNPK